MAAANTDPEKSTMDTTSTAPWAEVLPVVDVYGKSEFHVTLKWGEGGSKQTTAPHSTPYLIAPYSFSAVDSNGDEPFIKTFGSLLNCNDGILKIGKKRYLIRVQQQQLQQQQLPPNFSENATKGLEAFGEDYIQKKKTIVLNEATITGKNDLLDMIQLPERGASWESKPDGLSRVDTFNWLPCDEDHKDNRCAYMAYLNQKLGR